MVRKIIKIDKAKCNGCGLCVSACHEGAIGMVDGKAELLRDDYCDGLGDCLPVCPTGAISFEEREASPYVKGKPDSNHETGKNTKTSIKTESGTEADTTAALPCGCPGTHARTLNNQTKHEAESTAPTASRLNQWPVQIKLVPAKARYFEGADLLIAADCTAYAYGNFHNEFMRNKITLIGCPKLDTCDYSEKLMDILKENNIKSITVVRMEVPCCGGIEHATAKAVQNCGKPIPYQVVIISTNGEIL